MIWYVSGIHRGPFVTRKYILLSVNVYSSLALELHNVHNQQIFT